MLQDKYELRSKSDEQLFDFIAGWKPHTVQYIAGQQELRRRNERGTSLRSWIAIAISVASLALSILAFIRAAE